MSKNLIILAGGLNRRYNELARFSKVILPFANKNGEITTCLKNSSTLFNDFNKYVIVDSSFYEQVTSYIKANNLDITCIKSTNHTNSYETIFELRTQLPTENLLFIWSDIILETANSFDLDVNSNIIFTKEGNYRYAVRDGELNECASGGNIPGIYFLKSIHSLDLHLDCSDFVELFFDQDFITKEIVDNLTELRDKDTYLKNLHENKQWTQARYFNKIERVGDIIVKSTDTDHVGLIQKEIEWYKRVGKLNISPKFISGENNKLVVEYLDGYTNFYKVLNNDNKYLIDKLIQELTDLSRNGRYWVGQDVLFNDLYTELLSKVVKRVESVKGMILDYDTSYVEELLDSFKILYQHFRKDEYYYTSFHGDLNGSNTMIKGDQFKFIDPRNYFGSTVNSGPLFYEIAKVYYCLYGYDDFNANIDYKYYSKDNYDQPKKLADYEIDPHYLMLIGIIYISLTSYISDNVMKVNIAYQYGLKLLREGLSLVNKKLYK